MATEDKAAAAGAAKAGGDVVPVQMTRNVMESEIGAAMTADTEKKVDAGSEVAAEEPKAEAAAEEPKAEAVTETKADDEGSLPEKAKEIITQRIGEITAKSKTEVEAAQAEATQAKAEAETLKGQLEAGRVEHILKAGLLPEFLEPESAKVLESYNSTLESLTTAKGVLRFVRGKIEAGEQDEVFDGRDFSGKPFKGNMRQWRDLAEDARDSLDLTVRELAPQASTIKRTAAAQMAEIIKLGRAAFAQRGAAAKVVAKTAADTKKAPAQVTVKSATGTRTPSTPGSRADSVMGRFNQSPKDCRRGVRRFLFLQPLFRVVCKGYQFRARHHKIFVTTDNTWRLPRISLVGDSFTDDLTVF